MAANDTELWEKVSYVFHKLQNIFFNKMLLIRNVSLSQCNCEILKI